MEGVIHYIMSQNRNFILVVVFVIIVHQVLGIMLCCLCIS